MNNFIIRTLSGAFFVAFIVGSIILSPISFLIVFSIITSLAVYEFHKLTNNQEGVHVNPFLASLGGAMLFVITHFSSSGETEFPLYIFYGFFILVVIVSGLYQKRINPVHNWTYFLTGQIMIALPLSLLNYIMFATGYNPYIILALFIIIWVNDTGAYLTGVSFGKHRLFERVSPKKSWEGFFGGAVFALISGFILSRFITELSMPEWLVFSILVVIAGTYGDLTESLLKRTLQVKDSGNIIPGHGGILDRFDSLLLAAPVIFIFLTLLLKLSI